MASVSRKKRAKQVAGFLTFLLAASVTPLLAQASSSDSSSKIQAKKIYAVQCALCHGAEAQGGEYGPVLAGNSDLRGKSIPWLSDVIKNGIPSGGMPAFNFSSGELDALAGWIQSMNVPATENSMPGDRAAGEQYFFGAGKCATCHMVAGRGSTFGPDISSLASERTVPEIRASLAEPSAHVTPGYESVTVELRNGQTLHGFARSQSNFELTLQDADGKFIRLLQNQIKSIRKDSHSSMQPVRATPGEMENLMAYLGGLTGVEPGTTVPTAASAAGGISFSDILHPPPGQWLTYNGDLSGNRYSNLTKVNTSNVHELQLKWIYTVPLWKQFYQDSSYFRENMRYFGLETTPLVVDGILYATGPQ
jgi:putative heme-binding domain-containing protein